MSVILYEEAIRKIDLSSHFSEVGEAVAEQARAFSSVPAGIYPNISGHPWLRSGTLNANIESVLGHDENGEFVDVGTEAISPRQGYAYGYFLEASGRFTYLTAALEVLDIPFNRI